jgi:hypothetical protein
MSRPRPWAKWLEHAGVEHLPLESQKTPRVRTFEAAEVTRDHRFGVYHCQNLTTNFAQEPTFPHQASCQRR